MNGMHQPLPSAWLGQFSSNGAIRAFQAGDVLFHENQPADGLYILLSGQLKVYAASEDGREVIYNVLGPGELLGELSLHSGSRTASVRAVTDAECMFMKNSAARELMRSRPEFADHVLALAAARAGRSTRMTRSIALDDVPSRVIALLSEHAISNGSIWSVPSELIQQEIANRIGASREQVNAVMRGLRHRGFIHKDKKNRMTILKPLSGAGASAK